MSAWLHEDATFRLPDHLDEVLAVTTVTRQRPAWSSLERWLPVDTTPRPAPASTVGRVGRSSCVARPAGLAGRALALSRSGRGRRTPGSVRSGREMAHRLWRATTATSTSSIRSRETPRRVTRRHRVRLRRPFLARRVPARVPRSDGPLTEPAILRVDRRQCRRLGRPSADAPDRTSTGSTGRLTEPASPSSTRRRATFSISRRRRWRDPRHSTLGLDAEQFLTWLPPDGQELVFKSVSADQRARPICMSFAPTAPASAAIVLADAANNGATIQDAGVCRRTGRRSCSRAGRQIRSMAATSTSSTSTAGAREAGCSTGRSSQRGTSRRGHRTAAGSSSSTDTAEATYQLGRRASDGSGGDRRQPEVRTSAWGAGVAAAFSPDGRR